MKRMICAVLLAAASVPAAAMAQDDTAPDAAAADAATEEAPIVIEARTFMAGYAEDLLAGDIVAIANRYDRSGAWRMGEGEKAFDTWDGIRRIYAEEWQKPATFAWRDLSYEPVGPDAIMVLGLFDWGFDDGGPAITVSYTALMVRQEGELRIRLEDESAAPEKP